MLTPIFLYMRIRFFFVNKKNYISFVLCVSYFRETMEALKKMIFEQLCSLNIRSKTLKTFKLTKLRK